MLRISIKYYVLCIMRMTFGHKGLLKLTAFLLLTTYYLLHSAFLVTPVYAQASSTPSQPSTWEEPKLTSQVFQAIPAYIPPTSPIYTDLLVNNLFHSFSCLAIGQSVIGQPCLTYQVTKNAQGAIQSVPMLSSVNLSGGTLGAVTGVIGALYQNPPVRTADYLASVGQSFGIAKEARAQVSGSGANVLSPILSLWQVSRNISYVIMILIFVIIGVMVMFRSKINPQTVISAQAAIPGLVIGLILITFSYFLAGLVSDMAFVGTNVVGYYFQTAQSKPPQNFVDDMKSQNIVTVFSKFAGILESGDISQAITVIMDNAGEGVRDTLRFFAAIAAFQIGSQVGHIVPVVGDIAAIVTGIGATLLTAGFTSQILGQVLYYAAVAAIIYAMLRLLLKLISNYLTILFLTITAPFVFLAAALPGRQGMATGWILNMLGNVLAFPAVFAVFYFVAFLMGRPPGAAALFNITSTTTLIGTTTFPLLGGMNLSFIQALMAFGALLATPSIPDIINRTIGKAGAAGGMIEQAIGGNIKAGQGYASQEQQRMFGAASNIGQNYTSFRGTEPGYSPSTKSGLARWKIFQKRQNI